MSIEAYTAYRRSSRRRSSRTPFNPLKSIENDVELTDDFNTGNNDELEDVGIKIRTDPFGDYYTVECELGRGKFATVKKCRCNTTGQLYAAKIQRKKRKAKDARNELIHEIRMLAMCKIHPRIIGLKEVFETRHEIIIVTNFASGGELYKFIEDTEYGFCENTVRMLLQQTLEGLAFLHARNIVHMDIKPQNILLQEDSVNSGVLLCDLGFSRTVNSGEDVREIVGTPDFVAPEVLSYEPINTSSDMWSIGVLTYMMLTGYSPFAGNDKMETFSNITLAKLDFPDEIFGQVSKEAQDFISKLLVRNPSKRMTAPECFEHPWLEDFEVSHSESDEETSEDRFRNDLSTIKECEFEPVPEECGSTSEADESEVEYGNSQIKIIISDEQYDDQMKSGHDALSTNEMTDHTGNTLTVETSSSNNLTVLIANNRGETVGNNVDFSEGAEVDGDETSCQINNEIRNLTSIIEEEHLECVDDCRCSDSNNNEDELIIGIHESADQSKALKELSNHRKALTVPSPLSSPIGCRRTFIPSPETVLEVEPIKKHQCRRDSNEVKQLLRSNLVKVERGKILELDCDHSTDNSATVSKRGSSVFFKKTPITYVRDTKSLVTYYENLLQHV